MVFSVICFLKIRKKILIFLNLNDFVEIILLLNKLNIKFVVKKVYNLVEMVLLWFVDGFELLKEEFLKFLVYCNFIKDVFIIY